MLATAALGHKVPRQQAPLVETKLHDPAADRVRLDSAAGCLNFR
jgi:hypothetical protein